METYSVDQDRKTIPWPWWMVRFVSANSTSALEDLVQSVQSIPPYEGTGQEEAGLVKELIRQYRGPGMASEYAYEAIRKQIVGHQDATLALEAFHLHDRIASHQEVYSPEDVMAGLEIAAQLKHPGLR